MIGMPPSSKEPRDFAKPGITLISNTIVETNSLLNAAERLVSVLAIFCAIVISESALAVASKVIVCAVAVWLNAAVRPLSVFSAVLAMVKRASLWAEVGVGVWLWIYSAMTHRPTWRRAHARRLLQDLVHRDLLGGARGL